MNLPKACWNCHASDWEGRQEVFPPVDLQAPLWRRRTWCTFCDAAQDDIVAARDNPFLDAE